MGNRDNYGPVLSLKAWTGRMHMMEEAREKERREAEEPVPAWLYMQKMASGENKARYDGDVYYKKLREALTHIDTADDGKFKRSKQQREFHDAFLQASLRIIYRFDFFEKIPSLQARFRQREF